MAHNISFQPEHLPLAHWPQQVTVVDVTPRDGLQDAERFVSTEEKLHFISALIAAGVRHIEVTSFVHPKWIPQLADADDVAMRLPRHANVVYSALIPNMRGYQRAHAAGIAEVALVVSASEAHNRANLNCSISDSLAQLAEVAAQARADGVVVRGAVSTAFGCPFEGTIASEPVLSVVNAYAAMGVSQIALADTIGVGNPRQVYELFTLVRKEVSPQIALSAHFHDRGGYGLVNVFAALQAGITSFEAAIGGLGGCPYAPGAPGNLSTETLVEFLQTMGLSTDISSAGLAQARNQLMSAIAQGESVSMAHSLRKS